MKKYYSLRTDSTSEFPDSFSFNIPSSIGPVYLVWASVTGNISDNGTPIPALIQCRLLENGGNTQIPGLAHLPNVMGNPPILENGISFTWDSQKDFHGKLQVTPGANYQLDVYAEGLLPTNSPQLHFQDLQVQFALEYN